MSLSITYQLFPLPICRTQRLHKPPPLQLHRNQLTFLPTLLPTPLATFFQNQRASCSVTEPPLARWMRDRAAGSGGLFTMRKAEARPIPDATSLLFHISRAREKMKRRDGGIYVPLVLHWVSTRSLLLLSVSLVHSPRKSYAEIFRTTLTTLRWTRWMLQTQPYRGCRGARKVQEVERFQLQEQKPNPGDYANSVSASSIMAHHRYPGEKLHVAQTCSLAY